MSYVPDGKLQNYSKSSQRQSIDENNGEDNAIRDGINDLHLAVSASDNVFDT